MKRKSTSISNFFKKKCSTGECKSEEGENTLEDNVQNEAEQQAREQAESVTARNRQNQ